VSYFTTPVYYWFNTNDNTVGTQGTPAATYSSNTLSSCTKYKAFTTTYVSTGTGVSASNTKELTTTTRTQNIDLAAYAMSPLQLRVKDVTEDSYEFLFNDAGISGGTNQSTYTADINATNVYDTAATANETVGSDGKLTYNIYVKANNTLSYATDPVVNKLYVCVDDRSTGGNVWDKPVVSFDGTKLVEGKGSMKSNDLTAGLISNSEWCFPHNGAIDDNEHIIGLTIQARSGVNPAVTEDVRVSILGEGTFISAKLPNTFLTGVYTDNSTQALVGYMTDATPYVTLKVS